MKALGFDTSSRSVAWALIENEKLIHYGEFYLEGKDLNDRLLDCRQKMEMLIDEFEADYVLLEEAVKVASISTMVVMAKMLGVIISVLKEKNQNVYTVTPISWQSYIGNPNLKTEEKKELLLKHREIQTKSQQSKFMREYRKNRTIQWVKKTFDVDVVTDNQSDAIGIAFLCYEKFCKDLEDAKD
jgi:Holliday junction resolvasome RuvABC endonuclease subunit